MKSRYLLILIALLILNSGYSQDLDSAVVNRTDSIVSVIGKHIKANNYYDNLQGSSDLKKKVGGIIPMHVGSTNFMTYFHEDLIYYISINRYYELDNRTVFEEFYYDNNVLIRYDKEVTVELEEKKELRHQITAYYNDYVLVKCDSTINDGYIFNEKEKLEVTKTAREKLSGDLDLINN